MIASAAAGTTPSPRNWAAARRAASATGSSARRSRTLAGSASAASPHAASVVADLELGASAARVVSTDNVCAISSDLVLCGGRQGFVAQVAGTTPGFFDTTVGGQFECGVKSGGEAFCWGSHNEFGQLGDGGTAAHTTPGKVLGP